MRNDEGRFAGALGETYWRAWLPTSGQDVAGVVLLTHGVSEHTGRYQHVAEKLVEAGYAVYGLDHHGHGRSAGTPGNIGSMKGLVDDVQSLRRLAEDAQPDVPVYLLGHSLGGLIALDYLVTQGQDGLAGAVLSGAAVDPSVGTRVERAIAPLLSRVLPNLAIVELGIDDISRDPSVVQAYRDDPLVYTGKVRARTGAEILTAIQRVSAGLPELTLPMLVLHGGEDRLAAPSGGKRVYESIGSTDKRLKIYDGLFHEIFNEPEQDDVLVDVVEWLRQH